jgi:hypothetical protein
MNKSVDKKNSRKEISKSLDQGLKELKEGKIIKYKKGCLLS